ncbi:hypothetical protein LPB137_05900 [Poseidonibacter parvus]|uniref:histidine kinase n=1 Tax=Poseidonibacter parvus TaxID=1850254 RepID=A0A1P8KLK5_9BACT|nr:sensor histidine kinase [Poseidonibacter parvus]APW65412.1 hypothetical protein LPB137_05900 [Poseidonibacter parvus]
MIKRTSLKAKIILYFIIFATIPLLLASSWILFEMYKAKEDSVYNKHLHLVKIVEEASNNIISNIEYVARFIKDSYPSKKHNLIENILNVQKDISTILILDKKGILVDFSSKTLENKVFKGFDYSNSKSFLNIKNSDKEYWSDVYLSNISLKPEISYSLKINENFFAVLIINLSTLNDFASKFKSEDGTSMVRILDQKGIFLANPEKPELISQRITIKNTQLYKEFILKKQEYQQIHFDSINKDDNIGIYGISQKLDWYIIVRESYDSLFKSFNQLLFLISCFILLLIFLSIYFSIRLFKSIWKPLDTVITNMNNMAHDKYHGKTEKTEYIELDNLLKSFIFMQDKIINREKKIFIEIEKNRKKDIQLFEQTKMASMGEMIGNIAHQWRQPLSVISTSATGMKMQKEYNILTDESLNDACETINTQTQYLSKTIEDFKNFIKGERILETYDLKECMESFIELVNPSAKTNNINLILDFQDDIKIDGYPNELKQCLINIFNNAKDALISLNDEDKLIFINTYYEDKQTHIQIKDSAGGIPENILMKIFDPYYTTKHKSKGTGLGLHIAYNMIVNGMKGKVSATNVTYMYNNKKYKGASFDITLNNHLPKNL